MNSSYFFSGVSRCATIVLILFTTPVVLNAAAKTNHTGGKQIHASTTTAIRPSQTLQQRAENAAHQLLQAQRHLAAKKTKAGQTTPFGAPPRVSASLSARVYSRHRRSFSMTILNRARTVGRLRPSETPQPNGIKQRAMQPLNPIVGGKEWKVRERMQPDTG